jgi:hypothetical protein
MLPFIKHYAIFLTWMAVRIEPVDIITLAHLVRIYHRGKRDGLDGKRQVFFMKPSEL